MDEEPKPVGSVYIYMQIHHVSGITTTEQRFKAKFYFRATWVQKFRAPVPKDQDTDTLGVQNDQDTDTFRKKWFRKKIENDKNNWPDDVYMPDLCFANAEGVIELKNQQLLKSSWRKVKDDVLVPDECTLVVLEWKACGCGVFSNKFELENYPRDTQLLKITISNKDGDVKLLDDCTEKVRSAIRKDYLIDHGFQVDEALLSWYSKDDKSESKGATLVSEFETFVINPINERAPFHSLSYVIPVKRIAHHVIREILVPVFLITLAAMASFVFPPDERNERLTVSITISLVMAGYSYIIVNYLPRGNTMKLFHWYVLLSFIFVFLVVIQNCLMSFIACGGQICDPEYEVEPLLPPELNMKNEAMHFELNVQNSEPKYPGAFLWWDLITMLLLATLWLFINAYVFFQVFFVMENSEKTRIEEKLKTLKNDKIARDGDTEMSPQFKFGKQ